MCKHIKNTTPSWIYANETKFTQDLANIILFIIPQDVKHYFQTNANVLVRIWNLKIKLKKNIFVLFFLIYLILTVYISIMPPIGNGKPSDSYAHGMPL